MKGRFPGLIFLKVKVLGKFCFAAKSCIDTEAIPPCQIIPRFCGDKKGIEPHLPSLKSWNCIEPKQPFPGNTAHIPAFPAPNAPPGNPARCSCSPSKPREFCFDSKALKERFLAQAACVAFIPVVTEHPHSRAVYTPWPRIFSQLTTSSFWDLRLPTGTAGKSKQQRLEGAGWAPL